MNKFHTAIYTLGLVGSMTACTQEPSQDAANLPIIEIVATHAFDTKTQINSLTFIPNNIAPWLGRIILLDDSQHLFSTNIEGDTPLVITPKPYTDIAGIYRENAAGVFLAINESGSLEAFIQSDDLGNFKSLAVSGTALNAYRFCRFSEPQSSTLKILSVDGETHDLKISVLENILEYEEISSKKAAKNDICAANENTSTISLKFTDAEYVGKGNGRLQIHQTGGVGKFNLKINDGFSIKGLGAIDYINATTANYGGGAFKYGVIALIDKTEPRIVFVSLEYAGGKIAETNTAQDADTAQ